MYVIYLAAWIAREGRGRCECTKIKILRWIGGAEVGRYFMRMFFSLVIGGMIWELVEVEVELSTWYELFWMSL